MNYLIIGGSKSGKSEVGEKISITLNKNKEIYIALTTLYDKEYRDRIMRHIENIHKVQYVFKFF